MIGLILRGHLRCTRLTCSMVVGGICEPKIIELLAILRGLQIVSSMGIRKLIVESNCLLMIQICISKDSVHACSEIGILVDEIHGILSILNAGNIQHVYKEYNKLAHLLARYAWQLDIIVM